MGKPLSKKKKEVVVKKEEALFWLDGRGRWHNQDGPFENRRIIKHFHASIRWDKDGYHLAQNHRDYREKVYFPYEDTALFVFDVKKGEDVFLILNTGKRAKLKPRNLVIGGDDLYMEDGGNRIKFTEHALIQISSLLEFEGDASYIRVRGRRYRIRQPEDS
jgi:hypothetical protein